MVGLLQIMIYFEEYSSSTFEVRDGLAITAAAVVSVLLYYPPVLVHMYLAHDAIIMDFSFFRPFHCFLPSIYTNPVHTRSTSYLQYYELI